MNFDTYVPRPDMKRTCCGWGNGLAACPALGVVVYCDKDFGVLCVVDDRDFRHIANLGGSDAVYASAIKTTGWIAFTDGAEPRLLLTDAAEHAVHVIDIGGGEYVNRQSVRHPRGIAAKGNLTAVGSDEAVRVYKGGPESPWVHLRTISEYGVMDGQMRNPKGLRFSADGTKIVVADSLNDRVAMFAVADGEFVRHVATCLWSPWDVAEVGGNWLLACSGKHCVILISGCNGDILDTFGDTFPRLIDYPVTLAVVSGLGIVVRDLGDHGCIQVFATPDTIAMAAMSVSRLAWMTACARAILWKHFANTCDFTAEVDLFSAENSPHR